MWSERRGHLRTPDWRGRVWQAHAWYVVEDTEAQLVLFAPDRRRGVVHPGIPIPRDEWTLQPSPFQSHLLLFARPGEGHSTSLIWDADWTLREWYVNFERPQRPLAVGFDYVDIALDLVCYPDGAGSCSTRTSWRTDWRAVC